MTLQSSGAISLSDVNVELGRSSTATICMNCSGVRTLFGVSSGSISMSSGYGKSNIPVGSSTYTAPGSYTFVVPQHTTRLSGLAISGGASGGRPQHYIYPCFAGITHSGSSGYNGGYVYGGSGGYGGGITYRNNFSVTTGQSYTVSVASCAGGFNTAGNVSYVVSNCGSPSGYPVYTYRCVNVMSFFSGSTYGSTYVAGGRVGGSGSSAQVSLSDQRGQCPWVGAGGGGGGVAGSACGPVTNYCAYNGFYTSYCFSYSAGGSTYGRACGSFYQFSGSCCCWRNSTFNSSPGGGWPMYGRHGYGRSGGSAGGSAPSDSFARWSCAYCYYTGFRYGVGSGGGGGSNATYGFNNSGSFPSTGGLRNGGYGGGGGSGGGGGGSGSESWSGNCSHSGNGGSYGGGGGGASAALSLGNSAYGPNWSTSYYYGTCSSSDSWWNNRGIYAGVGAGGTVRLIYPGCTRSYPSTNVGCP